MPKLLLANTTSRALVARAGDIPAQSAPFYEAWADRLLWTLNAGDIAVVPGPVKVPLLDYMCRLRSLKSDAIHVLSLRDRGSTSWYPGDCGSLVGHLRGRVAGSARGSGWWIDSYIRDRDIVAWERLLLPDGSGTGVFAENMAELMNTKSVFRCIASAAGVPIAAGRVASRGDELVDAVTDFLEETGAVILKQDQNSGGDGNLLVTLDPEIPADGAMDVAHVSGPGRAAVARALEVSDLHLAAGVPSGCSPAKYVVEVYHPYSRSFYVELEVPRASPPRVRNFGSLRMTPLWSGFEIPARNCSPEDQAALLTQARRLAELAQGMGYEGSMNVDAIITRDAQMLINEFNGRAGGATHIHALCEELIGPGYLEQVSMVTSNGVSCGDFAALLGGLEASGIGFDPARRSGVIVLQDNTMETGTIEYVVIGKSFDEALEYEDELGRLRAASSRGSKKLATGR